MYIKTIDYDAAFYRIQQTALRAQNAETVVIFVAPDLDAICGCHMLVSLLQKEWIAHRIVPVASYPELQDAVTSLVAPDRPARSLIFINCGGIVDSTDFLPSNDLFDLHVYIFESRRPLNLRILFANEQISVFDDDTIDKTLGDLRVAFEELEFDVSDMEDLDDIVTDNEQEFMSQDASPEPKSCAFGSSNNENLVSIDVVLNSRQKRLAREQRNLRLVSHETRIREYYEQGEWIGTPVSIQILNLAQQLGRTSLPHVWSAIIAVTDLYMNDFITEKRYSRLASELQTHVQRLNPQPFLVTGKTKTVGDSAVVDPGSILPSNEPRLTLHRHWTLYKSMQFSPLVATRLKLWKEQTQNRLLYLFAYLGIPNEQFARPFLHMDKALKDSVLEDLFKLSPSLGIEQERIFWPSFVRVSPLGRVYSAHDTVLSLTALAVEALAQKEYGIASRNTKGLENRPVCTSFNVIYDTLNKVLTDEELERGVEAAKLMYEHVFEAAFAIMHRKSIKTTRTMRYASVREATAASGLRYSVQALRLLALVLFNVLRASHQQPLPLVVCTPISDARLRLLGYVGASEETKIASNIFGLAFQNAAMQSNADYKHDGFDSCVIEIAVGDFPEFIETLGTKIKKAAYLAD